MASLRDILDKINNSDGYILEKRYKELNVLVYIFERNYIDLISAIHTFTSDESTSVLWTTNNQEKRIMSMHEISRLFHNFLASGSMLFQVSDVYIRKKWYKNDKEFLNIYISGYEKHFYNKPLISFFHKLRDYTLHYHGLPSISTFSASMKPETGEVSTTRDYSLDKAELLNWKSWKRQAKEYLTDCNDKIEIESLAREYHQQVMKFHKWLHKLLQEKHKEAIADYVKLKEQRDKLLESITKDHN